MKNTFKLFIFVLSVSFISQINEVSADASEEEGVADESFTEENTEADPLEDPEIKNLPEIRITSKPFSPSLLEYGQAVTVLDKKELTKKAQTSLGETLRNEPGLSSSYYGPAASRPVIRGNAGERVRILRNGIGSLDVSNTAEDHQVTVNPLSSESIEILRGPETLLYGSSAIGGVVNIIDGTIPSRNIGESISGEYQLRTESADEEKTGAFKLEGQVGSINWRFSGLSQETKDIEIPGFARSSRLRELEGSPGSEFEMKDSLANSDTRTRTASFGLSHVWDNGYAGFSLTGYDSLYGIPGNNEVSEEQPLSDARELIDLEQWRIDSRGEFRNISSKIDKIRYAAGFSNYDHKEVENDDVQSRFSNNAFEGRVEVLHNPIKSFSGTVGTQVEYSEFSALGEAVFVPSSTRIAPGVFMFEEAPVSRDLKALFGARMELVDINPDSDFQGQTFIPFSLSSGLSWDIAGMSEYTTGISLAYTERAPASTELFANGVHFGRRIAELGNENLTNENSLGLDLTFRKHTGIFTGGVALFAQQYGNYINLASTGRSIEGFPEFEYTETQARFLGGEIETKFHIDKLLSVYSHKMEIGVKLDYVDARDVKNNAPLPRIPPFRTILSAKYGWKDIFTAGIDGIFAAAQRRTGEGELPTDAYQMLNTSLDINLPAYKSNNATLYAMGNNLTNEEARVHTSFIKDSVPLPGRSFILGLRGTF